MIALAISDQTAWRHRFEPHQPPDLPDSSSIDSRVRGDSERAETSTGFGRARVSPCFGSITRGKMRHTAAIKVGLGSLIAIITLALIRHTEACERTLLRTRSISNFDKQFILDMHNAMRQSIALGQIGGQPPAENMMEMRWDEELANRAQKWSQSCRSETHDNQKDVSRFPVGQNIATTWTTKPPSSFYDTEPDFADALSKWFDEFKFFRFGGIGRGSTGHYTQMIWAETNLIGCGYSYYYDQAKGYTKNYVCNYGPGGNVLGQTPYKKGYPNCIEKGLVDSKRFAGLCAKPATTRTNAYYFGVSNYIGR